MVLKIDTERVVFRPMSEDDLPVIADMVKELWDMGVDKLREDRFGKVGGKSWAEWVSEKIVNALADENTYAYVTTVDGELAAFCSYTCQEAKGMGEIGYNGVKPEYGGLGLGTYQMEKILDYMRKRDLEFVEVTTGLNEGHLPARKMYEKVGFEELSRSVRYTMKL